MFKNTKKQGDWGVGVAVGFFALCGYTVSIPLTDSQDYDLVVDVDGLKRVQVKTTMYTRRGRFVVSLTVKGGNRSGAGKIKKISNASVDYVFIVTARCKKYFIPMTAIEGQQTITLSSDYDEYVVGDVPAGAL